MSALLYMNDSTSWEDTLKKNLECIQSDDITEIEAYHLVNEGKLSILLAANTFDAIEQWESIQSFAAYLIFNSNLLSITEVEAKHSCYYFSLLSCIVMLMNENQSALQDLESDHPWDLIVSFDSWNPYCMVGLCDTFIECYETLSDDHKTVIQEQLLKSIQYFKRESNNKQLSQLFKTSIKLLIISDDIVWKQCVCNSFIEIYQEDVQNCYNCVSELVEEFPSLKSQVCCILADSESECDVALLLFIVGVSSFPSTSDFTLIGQHAAVENSRGSTVRMSIPIKVASEVMIKMQTINNWLSILTNILQWLLQYSISSDSSLFLEFVLSISSNTSVATKLVSILLNDIAKLVQSEMKDSQVSLLWNTLISLCKRVPSQLLPYEASIQGLCTSFFDNLEFTFAHLTTFCELFRVSSVSVQKFILDKVEHYLQSNDALSCTHVIHFIQLLTSFLSLEDNAIIEIIFKHLTLIWTQFKGLFRRELYLELITTSLPCISNVSLKCLRAFLNNILNYYFPNGGDNFNVDAFIEDSVTDVNNCSCLILDDIRLLLQLSFMVDIGEHKMEIMKHFSIILLQLPHNANYFVNLNNSEPLKLNESKWANCFLQILNFVRDGLPDILTNLEPDIVVSPSKKSKLDSNKQIEAHRLATARSAARLCVLYEALLGISKCFTTLQCSNDYISYAILVIHSLMHSILQLTPKVEEDKSLKGLDISIPSAMNDFCLANMYGVDLLSAECQAIEDNTVLQRYFQERLPACPSALLNLLTICESLIPSRNNKKSPIADEFSKHLPLSLKLSSLRYICYEIEVTYKNDTKIDAAIVESLADKVVEIYGKWFSVDEVCLKLIAEEYDRVKQDNHVYKSNNVQGSKPKQIITKDFIKSNGSSKRQVEETVEMNVELASQLIPLFDAKYYNSIALLDEKLDEVFGTPLVLRNNLLLPFLRCFYIAAVNSNLETQSSLKSFDIQFLYLETSKSDPRDSSDELNTFLETRSCLLNCLATLCSILKASEWKWKTEKWFEWSSYFASEFISSVDKIFTMSSYEAYLRLLSQLRNGCIEQSSQNEEESKLLEDIGHSLFSLLEKSNIGFRNKLVESLIDVAVEYCDGNGIVTCCTIFQHIIVPPIDEEDSKYIKVHESNVAIVIDKILAIIYDALKIITDLDDCEVLCAILKSVLTVFHYGIKGKVVMNTYSLKTKYKILSIISQYLKTCNQVCKAIVYPTSTTNTAMNEIMEIESNVTNELNYVYIEALFHFLEYDDESGFDYWISFTKWMLDQQETDMATRVQGLTPQLNNLHTYFHKLVAMNINIDLQQSCQHYLDVMDVKGKSKPEVSVKKHRTKSKKPKIMSSNYGVNKLNPVADDYGEDLLDFIYDGDDDDLKYDEEEYYSD